MLIFYFLVCHFISVSQFECGTPSWFHWLAGSWVQEKPNGKERHEVWTIKDNHTLTGRGLKISGTDTTLLEYLEIIISDDQVYYIPTVPDQNEGKPVSFRLVTEESNYIIFENPAHDFPQRIIYKFNPLMSDPFSVSAGDSILVRVESLTGQGMDFGVRR